MKKATLFLLAAIFMLLLSSCVQQVMDKFLRGVFLGKPEEELLKYTAAKNGADTIRFLIRDFPIEWELDADGNILSYRIISTVFDDKFELNEYSVELYRMLYRLDGDEYNGALSEVINEKNSERWYVRSPTADLDIFEDYDSKLLTIVVSLPQEHRPSPIAK